MKRKKEKFFGIGAVVLLILVAMAPLAMSETKETKNVEMKVEKGTCSVCSHAKEDVPLETTMKLVRVYGLFARNGDVVPLSMFGKIWGLIFGSNPISCLSGCAVELGALSIGVIFCLILAAGTIMSGGATAMEIITECVGAGISAVVFYDCFTSCMDAK